MNFKHLINTIGILLAIAIVFGAAMFGLNFITGPIIEENNKGAEFAPLLAVMPDAENFDCIYDSANADASTLTGVADSVIAIYKETSGKGFVVRVKASNQYSKEPMEITFGVTFDGKICGIQLDKYTDSIDFREKDGNYISSYLEKDSALADIGTVSGATYSSASFKDAVSSGFSALITNTLIAEGVKSDAQILSEMIPALAPGFHKTEEIAVSGSIEKAIKAGNDAGFAYVIKSGEASFLALVNASGACTVYDVEGTNVTEAQTAVADEAKAHASAAQKSYADALNKNITNFNAGATDITALSSAAYDTIVAGASFKADGANYYAFIARPFGYDQMNILIILDEGGAIVKLDCTTGIFFGHGVEYMPFYNNYKENTYESGFVGQTGAAGDNVMMSGATMTSDAVKTGINDAFAAYSTIKGGNR